ncbi:hypothetical protein A9R01_06600 ['Osedax' symbiont bacterium Rs2_46_30_T18]|nr:hypothetical protein A9R01_06600 ['Osedax' symbiont bacterium Rs2_46_30_T18]
MSSIQRELNVQRQLVLKSFSNKNAMQMGLQIVDLAQKKGLIIGVEVSRLNHKVFLFIDDGLPADKHNWIRRKANVAKHFEESSLAVKEDLAKGNMSLKDTFALDDRDYIARGGSIPIMVESAGLIATITVTGLADVDDHQLIVDALQEYF